MIEAKISLEMKCDKCQYNDTWDNYLRIIETKDDLNEPYDEFLKMAKEEGWVCHDGKWLCPNCLKERKNSND